MHFRYIAVCHPIRGKVLCTESRAKRVILCVFLICVSVTVPVPLEWVVIERHDSLTNQTIMEATFSELCQNATYRNIYYHLNVLLFVFLPLLLLVVFNSFLIRSVHVSTRQRRKMVMGEGMPDLRSGFRCPNCSGLPPQMASKSRRPASSTTIRASRSWRARIRPPQLPIRRR